MENLLLKYWIQTNVLTNSFVCVPLCGIHSSPAMKSIKKEENKSYTIYFRKLI